MSFSMYQHHMMARPKICRETSVLICVQNGSLTSCAEQIAIFLKTSESPIDICQHHIQSIVNSSKNLPGQSIETTYNHLRSCCNLYKYSYECRDTDEIRAYKAEQKTESSRESGHKAEDSKSVITTSSMTSHSSIIISGQLLKESVPGLSKDKVLKFTSELTALQVFTVRITTNCLVPIAEVHDHDYDVVIFLGHSPVTHWEPPAIESFMKLFEKENKTAPTIIAFLGCCGGHGSVRYGNIIKMSLLLDSKTSPIIGFYQRCVYVNELKNTSLLRGVQYYHHLQNAILLEKYWEGYDVSWENSMPMESSKRKEIAKFAFALAMCSAPANDPTVFVNDTDKKGLIQQLLDKCKLTRKDLPLSCLQLAMCSPMIVDSNRTYSEIDINQVNLRSDDGADKLDKWCRHKIREQQIHKLISLICEIGLLNLTKNTLKRLESRDTSSWKNIDHLQFLIAVLRGHWGINSFAVIKEWATFHLMKAMSSVNKLQDELHRYQLCCMCYVLLCDDHFVRRVVKSDDQYYHQFGILACTRVGKHHVIFGPHLSMLSSVSGNNNGLFDVTPDGYIGTLLCIPKYDNRLLPNVISFPKEQKLPWDELFQHCSIISDLVLVSNEDATWNIKSYDAHDAVDADDANVASYYNYKRGDFFVAMQALSDKIAPRTNNDGTDENLDGVQLLFTESNGDQNQVSQEDDATNHVQVHKKLLQDCYSVKDFSNKCDREHGMMACFEKMGNYKFHEMRVIIRSEFNKDHRIEGELNDLITKTEPFKTLRIPQNTVENITEQSNQKKVEACRFVFAECKNPGNKDKSDDESDDEVEGLLYYTDNHYGHKLIVFSDDYIQQLQHNGACIKYFSEQLKDLQENNTEEHIILLCCNDCTCEIKIQECVKKSHNSNCQYNCSYTLSRNQFHITLLCTDCNRNLQGYVKETMQIYGQCKNNINCGQKLVAAGHQKTDFSSKVNLLCGHCKYTMQQYIIDEKKTKSNEEWTQRIFPFVNTGKLTLKYKRQPENNMKQLAAINLQHPATGDQLLSNHKPTMLQYYAYYLFQHFPKMTKYSCFILILSLILILFLAFYFFM